MSDIVLTLVLAAAAVGSIHTLAPDHWMPFAAIGRARRWTLLRTARTTIACGFGHVTVSALLGIAALLVGLTVVRAIGSQLEGLAIYLLMAFGTVYMIWGLLRKHDHHQEHTDRGLTESSLFLLFCADPCVAVIPMIMAAASAGWGAVLSVILAYEIATVGTMVILVTAASAGVQTIRGHWVDHYGHALAGFVIVVVGAAVAFLGW
jgi:nickel/cobalt transporter (NicO) family protein